MDGAQHPDITDRRGPAANPAAVLVGAVLGIGALALAVIAARDLIVRAGWISGSQWLRAVPDWVNRLSWQGWMWPAAIGAIVVGLVLIVLAVRPRRTDYVLIDSSPSLWTRRADIARRASTIAQRYSPGAEASSVVRRRRVKITLTTHDPVDTVAVSRAVGAELSEVGLRQKVSVRVRPHSQRSEVPAPVGPADGAGDGAGEARAVEVEPVQAETEENRTRETGTVETVEDGK